MKVLLISRGSHNPLQLQALNAIAAKGIPAADDYCHDIKAADSQHTACVQEIISILRDQHCELQTHAINGDASCVDGHFDLVLAVGGDGTVLYANHVLNRSQNTIIGVRSSHSSVGHLCAYDYRHLQAFANALQHNSFKATDLQRIQASITSSEQKTDTSAVLNDFLFANSNPAATTRYMLNFQGQWETHKSSGIWVATAAGSSAALRAAGGSAMAITTSKLQFLVRELYQPLTSAMKGAEFDCAKEQFQIVSLCDTAMLSLDGQYRMLDVSYGDIISFRLADPLRIVLPC